MEPEMNDGAVMVVALNLASQALWRGGEAVVREVGKAFQGTPPPTEQQRGASLVSHTSTVLHDSLRDVADWAPEWTALRQALQTECEEHPRLLWDLLFDESGCADSPLAHSKWRKWGQSDPDRYDRLLGRLVEAIRWAVADDNQLAHYAQMFERKAQTPCAAEPASAILPPTTTSLRLHNWTVESYASAPDYVLDWSEHFEREPRRVPSPEAWQERLLPELIQTRDELLAAGKPKRLRLDGKACLSAGLAFGRCFSEVAGFTIELDQQDQVWSSDQPVAMGYECLAHYEEGNSPGSQDLLVVIGVKDDPLVSVENYVAQSRLRYRAAVRLYPQGGCGHLKSAGEALAFAEQTKKAIRAARTRARAEGRNHLFLLGPFGLAVFLGQKLTSAGDVQCYEYQNPGYTPSCFLKA